MDLGPGSSSASTPPASVVRNESTKQIAQSKCKVRKLGFTVLSEGTAPVADLIFIHGIQGHPLETWTYDENLPKYKNKVLQLSQFFHLNKKSQNENDPETTPGPLYWPYDLLAKDFKNVRILTYGYDSHVSKFFNGPANQNNIRAHGRSLLNALELYRRDDANRPLLFIVHSLGGIILKEALRRSKSAPEGDEDLRTIYTSTHAIVFFGTPHRGSSYADLGLVATQIVNVMGFDTNDALLRNLRSDGEYLEFLREEFASMLNDRTFQIYSFQEALGFKGFKGLSGKIVDDASSSLDHYRERRDHINANHVMMCRFSSGDDDGYIKVRGVLSKYLGEVLSKKIEADKQLIGDQSYMLQQCLHSLRAAGMNERQNQIQEPHKHTFEWIFSNTKVGFHQWLQSDSGLFWIKGKPGSGKSTLMKYILKDPRTRKALELKYGSQSLTVPGFFFHNRGAAVVQKSIEGLLRSILHQILLDIPELAFCAGDIYNNVKSYEGHCGWHITELKHALNVVLCQRAVSGCIVLFVDALDEYIGKDSDIASFLKDLIQQSQNGALRLRICASSREHNVFMDMLGNFPGLAIHDWTYPDIYQYISDRLRECKRQDMNEIRDEISKRARGVFLWVKLVIDELSAALFDGETVPVLMATLSELPLELSDYYRRILDRVPHEKRVILQRMLEILLGNTSQTTLIELAIAINLPNANDSSLLSLDLCPRTILIKCEETARQVRAISGGILQVIDTPWLSHSNSRCPDFTSSEYLFTRQEVQFLHQTAKELFYDQSYASIMGGQNSMESSLAGVLRMMRFYILLIRQGKTGLVLDLKHSLKGFTGSVQPLDGLHKTDLVQKFTANALAAEELSGISNFSTIRDFFDALSSNCGPRWPQEWLLDRLRTRLPGVVRIPATSTLAFAILEGLYLTAQDIISRYRIETEMLPSGTLLYLTIMSSIWQWHCGTDPSKSVISRRNNFFKFLFERGESPNTTLRIPYKFEAEVAKKMRNDSVMTRIMDFLEAKPSRINQANSQVVNELLGQEKFEEDLTLETVLTEHDALSQVEIERVTFQGEEELSPLHYSLGFLLLPQNWELEKYHLETLQILVENGADVSAKTLPTHWIPQNRDALFDVQPHRPETQSPLHYLIYRNDLYDNPFDNHTSSPLRCKVIKTLLSHGADPNAIDSDGNSVLERAITICPYDVVEMMLEKGAKITPNLLSKSGAPRYKAAYCLAGYPVTKVRIPVLAQGILNEDRWRRPECYTDEARKIARPYNPHWQGGEERGYTRQGANEGTQVP